jgi:hypothetical protein
MSAFADYTCNKPLKREELEVADDRDADPLRGSQGSLQTALAA